MKKAVTAILAAALIGAASAAPMDHVASHDVTFSVESINQITVGATPSLSLSALNTAGTAFEPVSGGSTYSVFTNSSGMRITAALDLDMPAGLTLALSMIAPGDDAQSAGAVELSDTAADLVTGISKLGAPDLGMTYTLDGDLTADATEGTAIRTVTFTLTGE